MIAVCQISSEKNKIKNVEKILGRCEEAARNGADLIIFPETSLGWYIWPFSLEPSWGVSKECRTYMARIAEPIPGQFTRDLQKVCQEYSCCVIAGLVEKGYANTLYNSAVVEGPEGVIGVYRKTHLPGGEKLIFTPGDKLKVFDTELGRIGVSICYDMRFPESVRTMKLMGAQIIVHITDWSWDYGYIYDVLARSHSAVNIVWFVSCGEVGKQVYSKKYVRRFWGRSMIVDPQGKIVKRASGSEEETLYLTRNFVRIVEKAETVRLNFLRDRRPELYGITTASVSAPLL